MSDDETERPVVHLYDAEGDEREGRERARSGRHLLRDAQPRRSSMRKSQIAATLLAVILCAPIGMAANMTSGATVLLLATFGLMLAVAFSDQIARWRSDPLF